MTSTLTAPAPAVQTWPCLPGCVNTADHTMARPDRACAVQVGATLSGLSVEARRDVDTGRSWLEFAGEHGPTITVSQLDALALAGALRDGVAGLRHGGLPRSARDSR